jgi:hypothetical protein
MIYHTNELQLAVPEPMQDRSVNVLLFGNKQPAELNLVISRDVLPPNEKFEYIVKKQLDVISSAQKDFKQTAPEKKREVLDEGGNVREARETAVSYKNQGHRFFQRHLYISLDAKKIMILVATAVGEWSAQDEITWGHITNSIRLKK